MTRLQKAASADPATWLIERLHGFAEDVGSVVPEGFEAYARVFHPALQGGPEERPVTWAEIAASTGRVFHAGAQWPHIAFTNKINDINQLQDPPPGAPWDAPPEEGSLDLDIAERFVDILGGHTSTPEQCSFAVWEGWGDLRADAREAPRFHLPSRAYFLFEGPISAATETFSSHEVNSPSAAVLTAVGEAPANVSDLYSSLPVRYQSAALWWPQDRAWCVATEVDFESTYIAGSRASIDAIVTDPSLEALDVEIGQGVTWDSDTVNPNPFRLPN